MENITTNEVGNSLKNSLVRIGDITFFEGPLLVLFKNFNNNDFYFYDWVDRDSITNRWLIYKVNPQDVLKFLNKKMSHFDLFRNVKDFFIADIDSSLGVNDYEIVNLLDLPGVYIPNEDSFFEETDCPSFDKILNFVSKFLSQCSQDNKYVIKSKLLYPSVQARINNKTHLMSKNVIWHNFLQGSFKISTHINLELLPDNKFDISGVVYLYKTKKVNIYKQENILCLT